MDPFIVGNKNLINQLGLLSTYNCITQGAYNVNTSQVQTSTVSYQVKAAQGTLSRKEQEATNLIGKQACDIYILPSSFVPKPSDTILYDGTLLEIKEVQVQSGLGGVTAGYKLLCVKG